MKKKCDLCSRVATFHSVEIIKGKKIEKHLCEHHAEQEGLGSPSSHTKLSDLVTNMVKVHSGVIAVKALPSCPNCGLTFDQFREASLLGCQQCYSNLEVALGPLVERAQEGGTHHVGKVPRRAGAGEQRQQRLVHMRHRLEEAVAEENYELAAQLRDEIRRFEEQH